MINVSYSKTGIKFVCYLFQSCGLVGLTKIFARAGRRLGAAFQAFVFVHEFAFSSCFFISLHVQMRKETRKRWMIAGTLIFQGCTFIATPAQSLHFLLIKIKSFEYL